jgi:zinc protease
VGTGIERWPGGRFTTSFSFGAAPDRVDSLTQVALEVLRKFAAEGPTPDEIAKVRETFLRDRETALQQNAFWVSILQTQATFGDDAAESVASFRDRVMAMDADNLKSLAKLLFDETNYARFTLLPERSPPKPAP